MLQMVKSLLKLPRSHSELRATIAAHLASPPFPEELSRQASALSSRDGVSFPDLWRTRVDAELRFIASKATWNEQRSAALDCLVNQTFWLALYTSAHSARDAESWRVFVQHDADFRERPTETWQAALLQKMLIASATESALITLLRKTYEYSPRKQAEIELYFETERQAMETRIALLDRILGLASDKSLSGDYVRAEAAVFDNEVAPMIDRERSLADVLREEIVYRSVDIDACRRQLDEQEATRKSLIARLNG